MTTAERLVRTLCENRRRELISAKTAALEESKKLVPFRDLPVVVQRALVRLAQMEKEEAQLKDVIKRAGIEMPYSFSEKVTTRRYEPSDRDTRVKSVERDYAQRFRKLDGLQAEGAIQVMGLLPEKAKSYLEKFSEQLKAL